MQRPAVPGATCKQGSEEGSPEEGARLLVSSACCFLLFSACCLRSLRHASNGSRNSQQSLAACQSRGNTASEKPAAPQPKKVSSRFALIQATCCAVLYCRQSIFATGTYNRAELAASSRSWHRALCRPRCARQPPTADAPALQQQPAKPLAAVLKPLLQSRGAALRLCCRRSDAAPVPPAPTLGWLQMPSLKRALPAALAAAG